MEERDKNMKEDLELADTPHAKQLNELRLKRLAFFEAKTKGVEKPSEHDDKGVKVAVAQEKGGTGPIGLAMDVRASMAKDARVMAMGKTGGSDPQHYQVGSTPGNSAVSPAYTGLLFLKDMQRYNINGDKVPVRPVSAKIPTASGEFEYSKSQKPRPLSAKVFKSTSDNTASSTCTRPLSAKTHVETMKLANLKSDSQRGGFKGGRPLSGKKKAGKIGTSSFAGPITSQGSSNESVNSSRPQSGRQKCSNFTFSMSNFKSVLDSYGPSMDPLPRKPKALPGVMGVSLAPVERPPSAKGGRDTPSLSTGASSTCPFNASRLEQFATYSTGSSQESLENLDGVSFSKTLHPNHSRIDGEIFSTIHGSVSNLLFDTVDSARSVQDHNCKVRQNTESFQKKRPKTPSKNSILQPEVESRKKIKSFQNTEKDALKQNPALSKSSKHGGTGNKIVKQTDDSIALKPIISFPGSDLDDLDLSSDLYMKTPKNMSNLDIKTPKDLESALSLNSLKHNQLPPAGGILEKSAVARLIEPDYESDYSELGLSTHRPDMRQSCDKESLAKIPRTHTLCFNAPKQVSGSFNSGVNDTIPLSGTNNSHRSASSSSSLQNLNNLENVLGKDKLERLMKNIQESEWAMEDDSQDETMTLPSHQGNNQSCSVNEQTAKTQQSVGHSGGLKDKFPGDVSDGMHGVKSSTEAMDIGFKTHRPPSRAEKAVFTESVDTTQPYSMHMQDVMTELSSHAKNYVQLVKETAKTKCAFSSDQIYAQADQINVDKSDLGLPSQRDSAPIGSTSEENSPNGEPNVANFRVSNQKENSINSLKSKAESGGKNPAIVSVDMSKFDSDLAPVPPSMPKSGKPSGMTPRGRKVFTVPVLQTEVGLATRKLYDKPPTQTQSDSPRTSSQKHIAGIKQHMEQRRKVQEEMLPPVGVSFNNPSLERYFNSIEKITRDGAESTISSENIEFDPVPEPDIENSKTPNLAVEGKNLMSKKEPSNLEASKHAKEVSLESGKNNNTINMADVNEQEIRLWLEKEAQDQEKGDGVEDDDDLFTKVTSVLSEMTGPSVTQRLKNLGIDFNFLKQKHHDISSNDHCDIETLKNVKNKQDGEVLKTSENSSEHPKMSENEKADNVKPLIHLPYSEEMKQDPEIPIKLNRETGKVEVAAEKNVKVCPECAEVNDIYVAWCVECGATLHGVLKVPMKPNSSASPRWRFDASPSAANPAQNFRDKLEKSLGRDEWKLNEDSEREDKFSILKRRECIVNEDVANGNHNDLRDSDNLEYAACESPMKSFPVSLKNELSLDLRASTDSNLKAKDNKPENELVKLSEDLHFEYSNSNEAKSNVSAELKAELSLNLRESVDSCLPSQKPSIGQAVLASDLQGEQLQAQNGNSANEHSQRGVSQISETKNSNINVEKNVKIGDGTHNAESNAGRVNKRIGPDDEEDLVDDVPIDDSGDHEADDIQDKFLQKLMNDARFRPSHVARRDRPHTAAAIPQPSKSGSRPKSGRKRPQSAGPPSVGSKVRASLEAQPYQRHWATSSIAWGSYKHGELRTPSTLGFHNLTPMKSSKKNVRDSSADGREIRARSKSPLKGRPWSAKAAVRQSMPIAHSNIGGALEALNTRPDSALAVPHSRGSTSKSLSNNAWNTYGKYLQMVGTQMEVGTGLPQPSPPLMPKLPALILPGSPRIEEGDFSLWLCLPDEILLYIFSFLPHSALARCLQTCQHFYRVASDDTLWRNIFVKKKTLLDDWLVTIGKKQPSCLSLVQCRGDKITANGLRELFRHCADSLRELNFTGCSRGQLTGDNILLHAASRCCNITHLDASWSSISDNGVIALAESSERLESVCLNGCQAVTDDAIHAVVVKHGIYLCVLELFGCFNMTSRAATDIGLHCKSLITVNLGQCWKLSDVCISQMSGSLGMVENLDLRGIKQMTDMSVHNVMRNCRHLTTLSLANCPNLTDAGLAEIATFSPNIRSLDVCGCRKLGNTGVRALAIACQRLEYLDMSSTGVTHKGVATLANYCNQRLEVMKLNFCKHINLTCLSKLAKHCKRLKKLYLYGVNGIRNIEDVRRENWNLWIEM